MLYNSAVSTYVKPHHVLSAINLVCMPNFIVLLHNTVEWIQKYQTVSFLKVTNHTLQVIRMQNFLIPNCIIPLYIDLLWKMDSMIPWFHVSIIWKCITRKKNSITPQIWVYKWLLNISQWDVDACIHAPPRNYQGSFV